jgi:CHASE3 domain sensor protein
MRISGRNFGSKLALAFGLTLGLTVLIAATSVIALAFVMRGNNQVIAAATDDLLGAQRLDTALEVRLSDFRAFILNGKQQYLDLTNADRAEVLA